MLQSDPMNLERICFCITGWHYFESAYAMCRESEHDLYVISHRPGDLGPDSIAQYVPIERIIHRPNLGYDWGCYQQFLMLDFWRSYDVIFFMHDDILIRSLDFIPHSLELLQTGAQVVGNGWNSTKVAWPRTHLERYAHSSWVPPSISFEHQSIRGSFFAITTPALERIHHFEVFWDPKQINLRFGNHSLIATSGKITAQFGEDCFAFLGSDYRNSPYILEEERGGQERPPPTLKQWLVVNFYNKLGRHYVSQRMQARSKKPLIRSLGYALMQLDGVERNTNFYSI